MQHLLRQTRVCSEEQIKEMGLTLDFDDIARKGGMSKEEGLIAKWYGIYSSRQPGDHMARIVIPGGIATSAQARDIARLAETYASGKISCTTRQAIQLHKLQLADLAPMLRDIKKVGLTTFHGCGDVTRIITACPWAKMCQYRRFDVTPYVNETTKLLAESRDLDNLPRKFKISFSGCGGNCALPHVNCVGVVAVVRKDASGNDELGFEINLGGGMGWHGFIAQKAYSFIPTQDIARVCRAACILFRDHGDRYVRKYARLKFVVDRLGVKKCRELLEGIFKVEGIDSSRFETEPIEECGRTVPLRPLRDVDPKDDAGLGIQRIMVPKGEMQARSLHRIAELAEIYGDKHIYTTLRQNIELHGVKPHQSDELKAEIEKLGFKSQGFYGLGDVVSCVGTTYCPLAVTRTHDMFDWFETIVHEEKYQPIRGKILVNITGCPNSCGQHYIGDIGLRGMRIREEQGSVESYQLRLGGREDKFGQIIGDYKFDDCGRIARTVLNAFLEACKENDYDSLSEHIDTVGVDFYAQRIAALNIDYRMAVNPLEYSAETGSVDALQDFSTIAKDVPCQEACPARTNIPEYIRLIKEGQMQQAHLINQQDNVLPGILGRICTHPCEDDCRHNWTNTQGPVRICHLKRAASDGKSGKSTVLPPYFEDSTDKRVAIIGAGPSGLAAARELKRYGHDVVIFEREEYAGGQVRMGVPEFRLPREIINEDIDAILSSGIEVKYGQTINSERLQTLCGEYNAVLVTIGANVPRTLSLDGMPAELAVEGLDFMKSYNDGRPLEVGHDVLIIGGGFTAVDCARSARRLNANAIITILYRRGLDQMAATDEEFEELEEEGIAIQTLVTPLEATLDGGKLKSITFTRNLLGEPDESGKPSFTPIADSRFEVDCSTLILAIGQTPQKDIFFDGLAVEGDHETSTTNLFVSGDFAMGNGDVINAVADGKKAADKIDTLLTGQERRKTVVEVLTAEDTGRIRDYDMLEPAEMPTIPVELRTGNQQVETGFSPEQTLDHSKRCYYCNYKFEIDQDKCIHCDWCIKVSPRDCISRLSELKYDSNGKVESFVEVPASKPEETTYIWINSDNCIRCTNCYNICPTDAISLRKADRERDCC